MNEQRIYSTLLWITAALSVTLAALFVYCWDLYFIADYAMIGVMAKKILEIGERPIFVWNVGHQGVLVEAYLLALIYKIFGISPYSLNFGVFLQYLLLVPTYFHSIRLTAGQKTATLATFFLVLSTPYFYGKVLRAQPNYTLIFLLGLWLFILYHHLWGYWFSAERPSTGGSPTEGSREYRFYRLLALFSFVTGFGIYTYGQIIYFLAPIAVHVLLSLALVKPLGALRLEIGTVLKIAGVVTIAGLLGYAPDLYYSFILDGDKPFETTFALDMRILENFLHAISATLLFLNLRDLGLLDITLGGFYAVALTATIVQHASRSWNLRQTSEPIDLIRSLPPIIIMPILVTAIFSFSAATFYNTTRYFVAIQFFFAFSVAYSLREIASRGKRPLYLAVGLFVLVSINNGEALISKFNHSNQGQFWTDCISELRKNDIAAGYADYWFAYPINYLTNEEIVMEPVAWNIARHYRKRLRSAKRIAYVTPTYIQPSLLGADGTMTYRKRRYRLEKTIHMDGTGASFHQSVRREVLIREQGYDIHILERIGKIETPQASPGQ